MVQLQLFLLSFAAGGPCWSNCRAAESTHYGGYLVLQSAVTCAVLFLCPLLLYALDCAIFKFFPA